MEPLGTSPIANDTLLSCTSATFWRTLQTGLCAPAPRRNATALLGSGRFWTNQLTHLEVADTSSAGVFVCAELRDDFQQLIYVSLKHREKLTARYRPPVGKSPRG